MPSREEIVEWLREAGRIDVALARMNGAGDEGSKDFALPWEQRAEQVEAMRCEACDKKIVAKPSYHNSSSYLVEHCPWQDSGGCFSHEQKPAG